MRITINGSTQLVFPSLGGLETYAAGVAADGFDGFWLAQIGLTDGLTLLAHLAPSMPGVELGTAVVPTFPRHPSALAAQALTVQAVAGGRLTLGIGLNHQPIVEGEWGMRFERPVRHLTEYLDIIESLLTTGAADVRGEIFTDVTRAPSARITQDPPEVMVAALGPQMLGLAGRRTAGTILWMVGPRTISSHIAPTISEAAAGAGRPAPRIVCSLPIAVTDDAESLRSFAATAFAVYGELPSYRAMLDREGVSDPAQLCLIGDEDEVGERLTTIAEAGATEFAAAEIALNDDDAARTRELLTRWRAAA